MSKRKVPLAAATRRDLEAERLARLSGSATLTSASSRSTSSWTTTPPTRPRRYDAGSFATRAFSFTSPEP